jgi:hypothetical protein
MAKLSGHFTPNTSVDVYAKESGDISYSLFDSVTTDVDGDWGTSVMIKKSTFFLAKSGAMSSSSKETVVHSHVTLTAKALGHDRVRLTANGDPNAVAMLSFYRSVGGTDPRLAHFMSNSTGSGAVNVTLPRGSRFVYVRYAAPGTDIGTSAVIKVNVK